ncbi:MAG TPA: ABC transporter permease [Ktedonobacterales bacterium]
MARYLIRRIIQSVVMLFVMSIVFFTLIHLIPGGPAAVLFSPHLSLAERQQLTISYGLDKPVTTQYLTWIGKFLQGDFGNSFANGLPVSSEIAARLPATLELLFSAFAFALVCAILLGVTSAVRQYTITDYTTTVLAYIGISMPIFAFGVVLQEVFGVQLGWLPTFSNQSAVTTGFSPTDYFVDGLLHLILPTIALSLLFIAVWSRYLRSSMLDVVKQDYIRTARAKGLSGRTVFFRHALRNALIPLTTQVAIDVGGVFSGAVITETVFAWPGLGRLFFDSLEARDYPVLLAMLMISTASVIFFNLVADVLYSVLDPRIRYS